MWFLLSSPQKLNPVINSTANYSGEVKFIVRQDNLTEFLSKNGGNWTVERIQEWTPKVHLDNEKSREVFKQSEPLSR